MPAVLNLRVLKPNYGCFNSPLPEDRVDGTGSQPRWQRYFMAAIATNKNRFLKTDFRQYCCEGVLRNVCPKPPRYTCRPPSLPCTPLNRSQFLPQSCPPKLTVPLHPLIARRLPPQLMMRLCSSFPLVLSQFGQP